MALTGELSDLSLAELIEFFCNQRKSGQLKVIYPRGPGYFYLQAGAVVHAELGALRGIDAVYYALTLPNASFRFNPAVDTPERTINQPWTSVVLEGLRRMDEGIEPANPFPEGYVAKPDEDEVVNEPAPAPAPTAVAASLPASDPSPAPVLATADNQEEAPAPPPRAPSPRPVVSTDEIVSAETLPWLWEADSRWLKKPWGLGAVGLAVLLILAAVGIPWGWYARSKSAKAMTQPPAESTVEESAPVNETQPATSESQPAPTNPENESVAARRAREARAKERAKAQQTSTLPLQSSATLTPTKSSAPASGAKKVTVQVTYDENGRVTQASGGDANALRIARQKRFPAGKAGSATITIPINQ